MKKILHIALCAGTFFLAGTLFAGTSADTTLNFELPEFARVVVVANAADPESLEVAQHYLKARKIPESRLIALPMPQKETISRKEYVETIHNPLLRKLLEKGLVDGFLAGTLPPDAQGRYQLQLPGNFNPQKALAAKRISYLVLCRGVPLRIAPAPELLPPLTEKNPKRGPLDMNNAAVDSEVATIGLPNVEINGVVANPFFKTAPNSHGKPLYLRVARLDGRTKEHAKALVDNAIKAERDGLRGRAYVDIGGGPVPEGDKWLSACVPVIEKLGFDYSVETSREVMHGGNRYDAVALYFGWYKAQISGFFLDSNFRFAPGAIAMHIHSFSATSMRSPIGWTAGLVARGVTATFGNVYEPYLAFTHLPHFFLEGLAAGMTAGEAATYSVPVFSWQAIFVGDPLYRPFKLSLQAQLDRALERPDKLSQYAYLRAMNLARDSKEEKKYEELSNQAKLFAPGLALQYRQLIDMTVKGKKPEWALRFSDFTAENPGLLLECARVLAKVGNVSKSMEIYEKLLAHQMLPSHLRPFVLREAVSIAQNYNVKSGAVTLWLRELEKR